MWVEIERIFFSFVTFLRECLHLVRAKYLYIVSADVQKLEYRVQNFFCLAPLTRDSCYSKSEFLTWRKPKLGINFQRNVTSTRRKNERTEE